MRRPIAVAVTAAVIASILSVVPTLAVDKPGCPEHKPLIVDVTQGVSNLDDIGEAGNSWALDTLVQRIRIWEVGTNAFCVRRDDIGSFVSLAGISPAGTATISAGVTGTLVGTAFSSIRGTFSPTAPTSGHIGDVDAGCNQLGECASTAYRVSVRYFTRVNTFRPGWFSVTYDGGSHGTFTQSTDGNAGDITG